MPVNWLKMEQLNYLLINNQFQIVFICPRRQLDDVITQYAIISEEIVYLGHRLVKYSELLCGFNEETIDHLKCIEQ
jgi:hypothetical protein